PLAGFIPIPMRRVRNSSAQLKDPDFLPIDLLLVWGKMPSETFQQKGDEMCVPMDSLPIAVCALVDRMRPHSRRRSGGSRDKSGAGSPHSRNDCGRDTEECSECDGRDEGNPLEACGSTSICI